MKYLHTMVRVTDLEASLAFYCDKLGLEEVGRSENANGRFTLVFLAAPGDHSAQVELTYNWDPEQLRGGRNFGHLAYAVDDIYAIVPAPDGCGSHDQSSAARRSDGVRAIAGQRVDRTAAARCTAASESRLEGHAEHRRVVARHATLRYNARPTQSR